MVDATSNETRFLHIPVVRDLNALGPVDGVVLTDMVHAQASYDALVAAGHAVIAVPRLLKVTPAEKGAV